MEFRKLLASVVVVSHGEESYVVRPNAVFTLLGLGRVVTLTPNARFRLPSCGLAKRLPRLSSSTVRLHFPAACAKSPVVTGLPSPPRRSLVKGNPGSALL